MVWSYLSLDSKSDISVIYRVLPFRPAMLELQKDDQFWFSRRVKGIPQRLFYVASKLHLASMLLYVDVGESRSRRACTVL